MNPNEIAAVGRLVNIALGDTGQSRHVASFLMSWWNADAFGGFKITSCQSCDEVIVDDIVTIFMYLARNKLTDYPDTIGYGPQLRSIIEMWRPILCPKRGDK